MKKILLIASTLSIALTGAQAAFAADADATIKYRQGVMKIIGGSVSNIAAILKGEAGQASELAALTQILATASDPAIVDTAFKENTDGQGVEKTTASAKIWSDWDKFTEISAKLNEAAKTAAAAGADVSFDEMKPVFAECKACHDDFRVK
ncbi:cytochrome c [Rhodobacteraceae bacterium NNCM2]|nr:cytochrome c [Coraliihabitans acroporae]